MVISVKVGNQTSQRVPQPVGRSLGRKFYNSSIKTLRAYKVKTTTTRTATITIAIQVESTITINLILDTLREETLFIDVISSNSRVDKRGQSVNDRPTRADERL